MYLFLKYTKMDKSFSRKKSKEKKQYKIMKEKRNNPKYRRVTKS